MKENNYYQHEDTYAYSSLSSSFEEDSCYLTASLSSSTSSLEYSNEFINHQSNQQAIWSSALYMPNLHPNLFESWSSRLNKSIYQLNEELKSYGRPDMDMNAHFDQFFQYETDTVNNTQLDNLHQMNDLYNVGQHYQQQPNDYADCYYETNYSSNYCFIPNYNPDIYYENDLAISYEEMNNKVNDLVESENEPSTEAAAGNSQDYIHINTIQCQDNCATNDDERSIKSVSPKLKFTAPRFEKKWLNTQVKQTFNSSHNASYSPASNSNYNPNLNNNNNNNGSCFQHNKQPPANRYYSKKNYLAESLNKKQVSEQTNKWTNNNNNNQNKYNYRNNSMQKRTCKCSFNSCTCGYTQSITNNKPFNNTNDTEPAAYRIKGNNMNNKNGQVNNSVGNAKSYPSQNSKYRYRAVSKSRA